jgi:PAS domain S-box-containing protein
LRKTKYVSTFTRLKESVLEIDSAYQQIFNLSPVAGFITGQNDQILGMNLCAEKLFGYTKESLIGKSMTLLFPQLSFDKSFTGKTEPITYEFTAKRKDGSEFYAALNSVCIETPESRLISWTITDISNTKKLLTELNERIKERRTLLSVTETLFKVESLEEIFQHTLPQIADGMQYPALTAVRIKLPGGTIYKTDNFVKTDWSLTSAITYDGKKYGALEIYYTCPLPEHDGSPFLNEEKELIAALGKLFSIFLNQWHTVKQLSESVALTRKITEQVPGNTYQFKLDDNGNIDFLFAGKGIGADNLGFSSEEMQNNPDNILRLIHPDDMHRFKEALAVAYKNAADINIQYRIVVSDIESWRWLRATVEKNESGDTIWYGYTQDITDIISYITVLEQILFDISHVMRQPVATMLGLTDYLIVHDDIDEKLLKDSAKHINTVASQIDGYIKNLNNSYLQKRQAIDTVTGKTLSELLSKHKRSN